MKRPLKYFLLLIGILLALRVCFALWFNTSPEATINHFVTGLEETETSSDEYQIGNCWTTIEVTSYSFKSCDTTRLDPSTYNPECGCYQWEKHIGKSFYTISICPSVKTAYTQIYYHSLLNILAE